MDSVEFYEKERATLRAELHDLKQCQLTFLTSAVSATGVLLGLGAALARDPVRGLTFLFPLTVALPAWWIFFDKARTISRAVGYIRVLEGLILGRAEAQAFVGWENALRKFREQRTAGGHRHAPRRAGLQAGQYWILCYTVFAALSALCVAASAATFSGGWPFIVAAAALVLLSLASSGRVLWDLIFGRCSYNANEERWKEILKVVPLTVPCPAPSPAAAAAAPGTPAAAPAAHAGSAGAPTVPPAGAS